MPYTNSSVYDADSSRALRKSASLHLTLKALLDACAGCGSLLGFLLEAGEALVFVQHLVCQHTALCHRNQPCNRCMKQVMTGSDLHII